MKYLKDLFILLIITCFVVLTIEFTQNRIDYTYRYSFYSQCPNNDYSIGAETVTVDRKIDKENYVASEKVIIDKIKQNDNLKCKDKVAILSYELLN